MKDRQWFEWTYQNPLGTWWKARKYFKMPKPRVQFFKNNWYFHPFGKVFTFWSSDVSWKWKYDEVRHELDPFIFICFFSKFGVYITFEVKYKDKNGKTRDAGTFYWEYLLDFLYNRKDLNIVNEWTGTNKLDGSNYVIPTKEISLKPKVLKELQKNSQVD